VRFLLDENVPRSLVRSLLERGHDAVPIPERLRGSADAKVLAHAARAGRILVTLDTDFGTLVFLSRRKPPPAVVLLRLPAAELVERVDPVIAAMESALIAVGVFVVIDRSGVRIRQMPRP
jgi:predicted nuclease of predicted toxin-antitoxin system